MTVTGRFLADYSDFVDKTKAAEAEVEKLEKQADQTAASLTKVTNPSTAGLEQYTTATKHAGAETSSMDAALETVGKRLATVFTVQAIASYAQGLIVAAGETKRMSDQTGIAADEIERLQYVATQTNTPIEAMVRGIQTLQQRLGSPSSGTIGAVHDLGLNLYDLQQAAPLDAFQQVITATDALNDSNREAADGAALLGGSWREVGAIGADTFSKLSAQAKPLADDTRDTLAQISADANYTLEILRKVASEALAIGATKWPTALGLIEIAGNVRDLVTVELPTLPPALDNLAAPLGAVTLSTAALAAEQKGLAGDLEVATDRVHDEKAAAEAMAAAMNELNSVGVSYQATVDGLNGDMVGAVRYYLEAGVAQGTLATAYGLTASEIRAIVEVERTHAALLKESTTAATTYADAMETELSRITLQNAKLIQGTIEADHTTRAYYEMIAEKATQAFDAALAAGDTYTTERLLQLEDEKNAAIQALADWGTAAQGSLDTVKSAADQAREGIKGASDGVTALTEQITGLSSFVGTSYPTPASLDVAARRPGSFLGFGTPAVASSLPSVANLPWTSLPGQPVHVEAGAFVLNYPILNDPAALDQLGRVVGDAILNRVTRTGTRV